MKHLLTHITLAALTAVAGLSAQTTISITPKKDNTLYQSGSDRSNGQGKLFCGLTNNNQRRRTLLRFDIAANVPAGAIVIAATMDLFVEQSLVALPTPAFAHRATQDWGEGTSLAPGAGGGGTTPAPGDTTWNHTFFPSSFWTTPGGDFSATNWKFPLAAIGAMTIESGPGIVGDVQDMLDNPANNYGWLLKLGEQQQGTARRIQARNHANPPTLNITYLLPSGVGTVGIGCPVGSNTSTLQFLGSAIGGTTLTIDRTNTVPMSIGADFFSLGIHAPGVQLQPSCSVYLPLDMELLPGTTFLSNSGSSSTPFAVPAGFAGTLISCQSAVLDSSPLGLSLSNAAVMILQ